MDPPDPAAWPWWVWLLHAGGALYLAGFMVEWVRFERLERRAVAGDADALVRFNRAVRGYPGKVYAKMCGKRPLVASGPSAPAEPPAEPVAAPSDR